LPTTRCIGYDAAAFPFFQANTMARNDWVALVTDPAAEYTARTELERLGLTPCRRWQPPRGHAMIPRRYPLFPRYLLLPIRDAKAPAIHFCRGVRRFKPILASADGGLWRIADAIVDDVKIAEAAGRFDEANLKPGEKVQVAQGALAGVAAVLETVSGGRAELFSPLLGGARIVTASSSLARL
jgi:hypothetical protein